MLRFAFGKVGGNIRRAFPASPTMFRGGVDIQRLGMNRMLCSVGQQEPLSASRIAWKKYNKPLMLGFGSLGLLGFLYGCWAYPIEVSIALLRYGPAAMKTQAAHGLYFTADGAENRVKIAAAGGIELLKVLLRDGTPQGKAWATLALLRISHIYNDQHDKIVRAGSIEALIALLWHGTPEGKTQAALGLWDAGNETPEEKSQAYLGLYVAANNIDKEVKIIETGGIEPLFALLRNGTPKGKAYAAIVILKVSRNKSPNQKVEIAEAGGIEAIISLLRDGTTKSSRGRFCMSLLITMMDRSRSQMRGVIEALIEVLRDGTPLNKAIAASTLYMAAFNADNKIKIVEAGGIELLKALLRDGTPQGKEKAAKALEKLTEQTA
ncbi:armadillo-type protein [Ochromonadaceae sp. CCMP2298]|nr:armadillo-type protein [Ochromonadaceae sp. CCMP2298]